MTWHVTWNLIAIWLLANAFIAFALMPVGRK